MRRMTLPLILLAAGSTFAPAPARADEVGSNMADAARRFLAALDDGQKARAAFAFDSPERFNWHWIPRERKGVPFKEFTPEQRSLAFGLLDTGLSTKGAIKATTIMSLEEILRVDEHGTGPVRDPELYFVSVFGTPSDSGEWGWRVEGHHLALNYTLRDGKVASATPFMFGSNPAEVKKGPRKGLRNLAEIEGPANALIASLTDDQKALAVVAAVAPEVTTTPNSPQPPNPDPKGISSDKLSSDQKASIDQLIRAYAVNFPDPVRDDLLHQVASHPQAFHFAWYGPTDISRPHAFRLWGPTLFIDFNDTQNQTNHIHTFFRSHLGDFGAEAR